MRILRTLAGVTAAVVIAGAASTVVGSRPARAETVTVTVTADVADAAPGDGVCATVDHQCTLRAAVEEATAHSGVTTIDLPAGTFALASVLAVRRGAITIHGAGPGTVIDGADLTRLLDVGSGASLTLQQLTLTNGHSSAEGGAVRAYDATLTLDGVTISASAAEGNGGGVFAAGSTVTVTDSTFDHDTALAGGALAVLGGSLAVSGSSFTNCVAFDVGGALSIAGARSASVASSTFATNTAERSGGAISFSGVGAPDAAAAPAPFTVDSSTFTGNDAFGGDGGAIAADGLVRPGSSGALTVTASTFDSDMANGAGGAISSLAPLTTGALVLKGNTAAIDPDVHTATNAAPVVGGGPTPAPGSHPPVTVARVAGPDRIATAVEISRRRYPMGNSAATVVLARSDVFADALVGAPLSVAGHGPLLLTSPDALSPAVQSEIRRVMAAGGVIYALGGTSALSDGVLSQLAGTYRVIRVAGVDRAGTAVAVGALVPAASTVLLADGSGFADALSAGAAAAHAGGIVLLSDGPRLPTVTASFLSSHPGLHVIAVGGPAAAALPSAEPVVGADRYETAVALARRLFTSPAGVALASGRSFPDGLAGGADAGAAGVPLLLVDPQSLPAAVANYLVAGSSTITTIVVYGGEAAVAPQVPTDATRAVTP